MSEKTTYEVHRDITGYVLQGATRLQAAEPEAAFREAAALIGRGPVECPECGKIEVRQSGEDGTLYAVCPCCDGQASWRLDNLPTRVREDGTLPGATSPQ